MGLTSAMYVGLTGLNVHQARINTIGNNLANVNTTGFKASRTEFQTLFSQTFSQGTAPSGTSGGVNPTQIGLGAAVGGTQRLFTPGAVETTGLASDLAIEGNGLFILRRSNGQQVYTRDGSFALDANNQLVSIDGYRVLGYGVDEAFQVIPTLSEINIPIGTLSIARATENVQMDGDLSAAGSIATQGSTHASQALVDGGGNAATAATALTDLRSASDPATALFLNGTTITVSGITKGQRSVPAQQFVVGTDGSTLGDFGTWLQSMLGIQSGGSLPGQPGVVVENGTLVVRGNAGEENAIEITNTDITTDNVGAATPFSFTQTQPANGSGVFTAFSVYDSLGNPVNVNVTFALEATPDTGPVWRYYVEAPDGGASRVVGTGTLSFDPNGNLVSATGSPFSLDRSNTGAQTPLSFTIDFSGVHGLSTATSNVILANQDGFPPGTLSSFSVARDGTINATFTNGLTRTLGQVALAVFPNFEGLVAEADNLFLEGPNSGQPTITAPGTFQAGTVLGGALELSNVDMTREFIGLITSSAGFQAASRVISTSSDMLDQLLLIVR